MKPYSVTIYYHAERSYFVDAHNDTEAEEMALDYFAEDTEEVEITDIRVTEDDPDE